MPQPGKMWWHVVLSTYGSWLPGDARGFRSKDHKIHSSGDYKSPPPRGEHEGLHIYHRSRVGSIVLTDAEKPLVGNALWDRIEERGHRILVLAVARTHAHFLAELPIEHKAMKHEVGEAKRVSSLAVTLEHPGGVWAREGDYNRVKTEQYHRQVYGYILGQEGAWIRTFKDAP